ncbi:hypothetical protein MBANPS3_002070 [Mucor bainieri]
MATTLSSGKSTLSASLQLYNTDLRPILQKDPGYQEFLNSLEALTVKTFEKPRFNIEPALLHLRSFGDNLTMSTKNLTQELCFLLAITGFLRNADIHRINVEDANLFERTVIALASCRKPMCGITVFIYGRIGV